MSIIINFQMSVRVGLYHIYLSDWLKVFPEEQLLVIRFEDYMVNPVHWVNIIYQHIGIGTTWFFDLSIYRR